VGDIEGEPPTELLIGTELLIHQYISSMHASLHASTQLTDERNDEGAYLCLGLPIEPELKPHRNK